MAWGDIKKGDRVWLVYALGSQKERVRKNVEVLSVGRKWITTSSGKFSVDRGLGEFGHSIHTPETYERRAEMLRLRRKLGRVSWGNLPLETLKKIEQVLDEQAEP